MDLFLLSTRHHNCLDKSLEVQNVDNTTVQYRVSDVKTKALRKTKNLFMAS